MEGSSPWLASSAGPGQASSPPKGRPGKASVSPPAKREDRSPCSARGQGPYPEGAGPQGGPALRWRGPRETHLSETGLTPLSPSRPVPRLCYRFVGRHTWPAPAPAHPGRATQSVLDKLGSAPAPANLLARLFRPPWRGGAGHAGNVESVTGPPEGGGGKAAPPTIGEPQRP